jgi:hypothetical protein
LVARNGAGETDGVLTIRASEPLSQTIAFDTLTDRYLGDPPFTLSASASSGLPVIFTVVSGPATISGNTITLTGQPGTVTIRAEQAGGEGYRAAGAIEQSFVVRYRHAVPVADAGGPYTVEFGRGGAFDGSRSHPQDPTATLAHYRWDLTDDGSYDVTGNLPILPISPAELTAAGITRPGTYTVRLEVEDSNNLKATATTTLVVTVYLSVPTALDAESLYWVTWTEAPWSPQTTVTHDGLDALRSGSMGDQQSSVLETVLLGPGELSYWWKVSSETNSDFLFLLLDRSVPVVTPISGEVGWRQETLSIPPGVHALYWAFLKDEAGSAGADAGWVDQVAFTPAHTTNYLVLEPSKTGWIASNGVRSGPNDTQYPVGDLFVDGQATEIRDWFWFKPFALSHPIAAAELRFYGGEVKASGGEELLQLHSIESSPDALVYGAATPALFGDLGDGPELGRLTLDAGDSFKDLSVPLNSDGIAALHKADFEAKDVLFGGAISTLNSTPADGEFMFGSDDSPGNVQLVILYGEGGLMPVADAGGPYTIPLGGSLTLDGRGSHHKHPAGSLVGYGWDFGANGTLDVIRTNDAPAVLTPQELASFGLEASGTYRIRLYVEDANRHLAFDDTTLVIEGPRSWTWNGGSGDWFTPTNWTPNGVPAASDTVTIGTGTVHPSRLVVHEGTINWTGGALAGNWTMGTTAQLLLSGTSAKVLSGTLTNAGLVRWTSGDFTFWDQNLAAPTLVNEPGGIVDIAGDLRLTFNVTRFALPRSIFNRGVFRKSAGLGPASVSVEVNFTNLGRVECFSGVLSFTSEYFRSEGGTLAAGLRGPTAYGAIEFNGGPVDLSRMGFEASLLDEYAPALPSDFLPVRFVASRGRFASVELPAGTDWDPHYLSTAYHLGTRREGLPVVLYQPSQVVGSVRDDLLLAVGASGSAPVTHQWQRDGQELPGATNQTLVLPSARFEDAGLYTVVVSNALGVATSQPARLEVVSRARAVDPISMFGDTSRQFLEILSSAWTVAGTNYALTMEVAAPFPTAAQMAPTNALTWSGSSTPTATARPRKRRWETWATITTSTSTSTAPAGMSPGSRFPRCPRRTAW